MYVVSGCPRSGTSLMMDILREVFGEERILGKKFPQEERIEEIERQGDEETDEHYAARMYLYNRNNDKEKILKDLEESKDMNPNGFWEMLYSVQGIQYRLGDIERLNKLLTEEEKSICKIVSQGLANSDPRFIDKMIYMIRHPRQVAKSQERLKRQFPMDQTPVLANGEEVKVHTPEMYINVTNIAASWLVANPKVPVLFINFDDLIENPDQELSRIQEFLGEGDFSKANGIIQPKLKRSLPQNIDSPFWEDAEAVYDNFVKGDFEGVIEYLKDPSRAIYVENTKLYCTRCEAPKAYNQCKMCRSHEITRNNMRKQSEDKKIDWKKEPCLFECLGLDPNANPLTLEESIKNNFWFDDIEIYNKEISKDMPEPILEAEDIIFNKDIRETIVNNIDIFKREFENIDKKDWKGYVKEQGCPSCKRKVFNTFRQNSEKMNRILSELMEKSVNLIFPGPIEEPIIKEFDNIIEMQSYLKSLQKMGKKFRSATPSPNGKGGYILVVL
jgi:hypothetical protein